MPPTTREATTYSTACRWCLSEIKQGARVCTECKKNQSRAIEYSRYLLTLSALLAALLSAATYVQPTVESWVRSYLTPEFEVNAFQTETDRSVIVNVGPSDVFVQHITATPKDTDGPMVHLSNFFHVVNQRLKHGEVLKLDLESDRTKLQKRSMEPTFFDRMLSVPKDVERVLLERIKVGDPNVRIVLFGGDHPLLPSADGLVARLGSIQGQSQEIEILSYPYLCTVDFLHRYSETLSPYEFSCVGFIETTYSISELKEMALVPSPPGALSEPVGALKAAPAAEELR